MTQNALDNGVLVTWTKSFDCPDAVGKDVVQFLKDAILRKGLKNVDVVAILNDTTGTLVKGLYLEPDCAIGNLIF